MKKEKTRLLILTDISSDRGGFKEPDDTQSLVRLLLYSNELKIEGLIATYTSHWEASKMEYIDYIVRQYGKVRDNLIQHDVEYPTEQELLLCIKKGSSQCGMEQIGEEKDSEGSDWIITTVDKSDEAIWILVWGAPTDLAQALWKIKTKRSKSELENFVSKLRVYAICDQYDESGPWIKENFKDLFYITNYNSCRGMYKDGNEQLVSSQWLLENVCTQHGELGEAYPVYDGGDPWGKVTGIKEGDTPSFLYLIPNGLSDPEKPEYGSWGGRFEKNENDLRHYTDIKANSKKDYSEREEIYQWRDAYQSDFAARMDWCIKAFDKASHRPVIVINDNTFQNIKSGESIILNAEDSYDLNNNDLYFSWYFYKEVSSYKGELIIDQSDTKQIKIIAPVVNATETIHILLTVTNSGKPALRSYKRIVIYVNSK